MTTPTPPRSVSFSNTNIYFFGERSERVELMAPADQMGDELDLVEFEMSAPQSPIPTADAEELVERLIQNNKAYKVRDGRAIRHLRKSKRETGSWKMRYESSGQLFKARMKRKNEEIGSLKRERDRALECNKKFIIHSEQCEKALKSWKKRETVLLDRLTNKEMEIERLRKEVSQMREEREKKLELRCKQISELTQTISELQYAQSVLQNEIEGLNSRLQKATEINEQYARDAADLKDRQEKIDSIKAILKEQLEKLADI